MKHVGNSRVVAGAFALCLILVGMHQFGSPPDSPERSFLQAERARLVRLEQHLQPGSAAAFKTGRKLERLAAAEAGRPRPEHPDEFARILYEMKVPSDREAPEYTPSYRKRELERAVASKRASTPLPWIERGPGNVAGRARGLIVDPADPSGNTWFVGSVGGGIWKTSDGGATWQDVAPGLPNLPVSWLAMAASNPDVMYAGTGESMFNVDTINGNGILKSIDHGQTWAPLASTLDNPEFNNISRIMVDPEDPDIVVASATTGRYKMELNVKSSIFKSTDGGLNWTEVFFETDLGTFDRVKRVLQVIATPGNFDVQYATVDEKGILKSTDAGDTWAWANTGISDFSGRFEIAISPVEPSRVFASAEGVSSVSQLWVSTNAGASWSSTFESGGDEPNWLGYQGWYDNTIVCHPTNVNVLYVGGIRLWQITLLGGGARTTTLLASGPVHVDHHNLVIVEESGGGWRLLNANDGGIGVSAAEASSWSRPIDGLNTSQFYGVDKKPGASAYIGGMQDNGTWRSPEDADRLDPWVFQIGGDGYETSWHFDDPLKIIGGYQFNGLTRSLDGGETWESAQNGLVDVGGGNAPFITKIAKCIVEPDLLFAVGAQGVWRSTDFGGNWTLTSILAPDWAPISSFTDVKISRADPDVVWAGARMDDTGKMSVSVDRGLTFSPTTNYSTVTMGGISGLATHPTDPNTAYVLFAFAERPKILRTTDLGATWEDISGFETTAVSTNGFPDVAVYDLLVMPHDPSILWAGTEIGLFESTDAGVTWHMADNGFPAIPIWFMCAVEDEVVLATHGRGIWSAKMPELTAGQTFNPLVDRATQGPDGLLSIEINLRSPYDQSLIRVDGQTVASYGVTTEPLRATVQVPVLVAGTVTIQINSTRAGEAYDSVAKLVDVIPLAAPVFSYANDFNTPTNDFFGTGFTIGGWSGFSDGAIHSPHNYPDATTLTTMLTVPVAVAPANATVSFDEVALIEPGEPGSTFGDSDFWDYVIVEGTIDGMTWIPLDDGYDARQHPEWLSAYNAGTPGDSSMLRSRQIDLLDTFSPGDLILVRFRLYADPVVNGWGWVIDNLEIQTHPTGTEPDGNLPARFVLEQNAPNPFNPATEIRYRLPLDSDVTIKIYDLRGREVRTLVDEHQKAGSRVVRWDGRSNDGALVASGIYVYRMLAGEFVQQRKMTLVK